jgi:hypothetical protein
MNGLIFIAFGPEYDKMAAHCLSYSRNYTDISITVITNLTENQRHEKWNSVKNIEFRYIDKSQDSNRKIKTSINVISPYEKTLYLDCDVIIQKEGIEQVFDLINDDSILLNLYGRWDANKKLAGVYRRTFVNNFVSLPANIYYGALVGFSKSNSINTFFETWHKCWVEGGSGRDMPALACAVKKTKIKVNEISNKDKIFSWLIRKDFIIQHEYGTYLRKLVGCADFKQYKPFDKK